jgi:hypothetical protein
MPTFSLEGDNGAQEYFKLVTQLQGHLASRAATHRSWCR